MAGQSGACSLTRHRHAVAIIIIIMVVMVVVWSWWTHRCCTGCTPRPPDGPKTDHHCCYPGRRPPAASQARGCRPDEGPATSLIPICIPLLLLPLSPPPTHLLMPRRLRLHGADTVFQPVQRGLKALHYRHTLGGAHRDPWYRPPTGRLSLAPSRRRTKAQQRHAWGL